MNATMRGAALAAAVLWATGGCASGPEPVLGGEPVDILELEYLPEARDDGYLPMVVAPVPEVDGRGGQRTPLQALAGREAPIKDVIVSLFRDSDLNVLIDGDVDGAATFDIKATTTEDAFSALLRYLDLSYRVEGDFIRISTREHRVFNLDLLDVQALSGGGGGGSTQGNIWDQIGVDLDRFTGDQDTLVISPMSGTVEVEARPSVTARVKSYLGNLVGRVQNQVSLETRVIEVNLSDDYKFGVDFSIVDSWVTSHLTGTLDGGAIAAQTAKSGGDVFSIGFLNDGRFELFLDALEGQGQVRVLSSPRVSTMNNVPANIRVAEQIPVIEREVIDTEAGSRTEFDIRFVDAGIVLSILPQVGDDGFITVWVNPVITEQTGTVTTPDGLQEEPIIATREATTTIRVADGEAIVIGGLRTTRKGETLNETPLLSAIPGFGMLFRSTVQERSEVELVVVVIPRRIDNAWRKEELRRSFRSLLERRRTFKASTLGLEDSPEPYDLGLLSGADLPPDDLRLGRASTLRDPSALVSLPTATITRSGMAEALIERAVEAAATGQYAQALELLDQVLSLVPGHGPALAYGGLVELERGRLDKAIDRLDRALLADPSEVAALSLRGIAELRLGAVASAVGYLDQAHRVAPTPETANNLAAALIMQGDLDGARIALAGADLRGAPRPEARLNLAYLRLAGGDLVGGEQELERALRDGAPAGGERVRALRAMIERLRTGA